MAAVAGGKHVYSASESNMSIGNNPNNPYLRTTRSC